MTHEGLNPEQKSAVEHDSGPLLVLAGAGSGKTRVITHRIARLIERGTRPEQILAVSFTNKAAAEMGERMVPLVGDARARKIAMSTFHSFGVRLLSEETRALGIESGNRFVIFDQGDCLGLLKELAREIRGAERKLDMAAVLARISRWKSDFVDPEQTHARATRDTGEYDEAARELYPRYEKALRAMHAVDFDDLVIWPVRVLRDHPSTREKWQNRFRYLLVDEFQDTSRSQLELVRLLANPLRNVCVVGDDDQSIYSWRGADVTNILEFEKHFPGARVVKLEENYRSRQPILSVANTVIGKSRSRRHGKILRTAKQGGDPVRLVAVDDAEMEAKLVAEEVSDLISKNLDGERPRHPKDIAILYRSNLQARLLEEELRGKQIPYRMFGGTQFFDRKEVKDAAAYLRWIVFPRDEISLRRILNYPARGIGETAIDRIERWSRAKGISLADTLPRISEIPDLSDSARRGVESFYRTITAARAHFHAERGLATAAKSLFEEVGLIRALADAGDGKEVAQRRIANIEWLLGSIERYERAPEDGKASLAQFLSRITLRFDQEEEEASNRVVLSTLHAAKGLEFPIVFVVGCVEGVLPHSRTTDPKASDIDGADVEEERRLFYVGVTRARERLYLCRFKRRMMRGRPTPLTPSRFLDELPAADSVVYERAVRLGMDFAEIESLGKAFLEKLGGS